ncbi:glycosyltransferase family A protein [Rhodococcus erythropolis]|uniref:glycosyltransferase family 2 protein n=1 Tax=Rhodococcus erythropolis TaxID=1833 RepID=UPI002949C140|nr:glycosyltransferase family A protein [Rhodococcus erythropolis]MDV6273013.1 glycosyltransferase family A protein [Rhodococcus erythropolis]
MFRYSTKEDAVSDCIEGLLTQSEIDEILIVDNNSTDGTASIIQEFAQKYGTVRYVFEARQGVAHARNAGFDASTGNIISRIDADTRVQPGWARAVKAFLPLRIAICSNPPLQTWRSENAHG